MSQSFSNPYESLPARAFWSRAVARPEHGVHQGLYSKKFEISKSCRIATAGSCFAQHIGRRLKRSGFAIMDVEPAPSALSEEARTTYNYSIYSARYGNIYTVRQMRQLAEEAFGLRQPTDIVWATDTGRFFDALRPGIEPEGLSSPEEVAFHRAHHLKMVRTLFESMDLLIFTMGLTEAWVHSESGTVYPMAPGVMAGRFDPERFEFKNFTYNEIMEDFKALISLLDARSTCSKKRFLITVSPVPLTATASGHHVMVATTLSKSILRAVAGELESQDPRVDYFPSFEMVANPWSDQPRYESNMRSVRPTTVDEVMRVFMLEHEAAGVSASAVGQSTAPAVIEEESSSDDVVCEESLLEAFGTNAQR